VFVAVLSRGGLLSTNDGEEPDFTDSFLIKSNTKEWWPLYTQVRNGSLAATRPNQRRGCFTPESRRDTRSRSCPLWVGAVKLQCPVYWLHPSPPRGGLVRGPTHPSKCF
jgi:hypothetical protein